MCIITDLHFCSSMWVQPSTLRHYCLLLLLFYNYSASVFLNILLCIVSCFVYSFSILCFCNLLSTLSPHVCVCLFPVSIQVYRQLPPGGNPTALNKYIISYRIISKRHRQEETGEDYMMRSFTICTAHQILSR